MTDGTPLPDALSGVIVERIVRLDSALLYLLDGAWSYLLDREPLEQTGALTVENAREALSEAFYCYLWECSPMPIGSIQMWPTGGAPDKWLLCNGQVYGVTEYPELYELIGTIYGGTVDVEFNVPDFVNRSPMGFGDIIPAAGWQQGAFTHTLSVPELPAHTHNIRRATGGAAGANNVLVVGEANVNTAPTLFATNAAGGGGAHNNLHPILGVAFIIYAGR